MTGHTYRHIQSILPPYNWISFITIVALCLGTYIHLKGTNIGVNNANVKHLCDVKWSQNIPHSCSLGGSTSPPFTQGLFFSSFDRLIESSGLASASFLREFSANTGETIRRVELPNGYFAEGATFVVEPNTLRLYVMVLTYKDNVVLFYDYKTFQLTYVHQWRYVGFGLTSNYNHDTNNLEEFVKHQEVWMTTGGTHLLSLELPPSFRFGPPMVKKAIPITFNGLRLRYVNEMDYNHETGTIYGNIWTSDFIVEVDPKTGICLHLWDLTPLKLQQPDNVDVMNGIACDSRSKGCLITGKFWPNIYNVDLLITATSARDVPSAFYHDYCTEFKAPSEQ